MEGLGSRIALLESLVKGLLPEADLSSNDEMQTLAKSLGIPLPVMEESYGEPEKVITKQEDEYVLPLLPDQQRQVQYVGPASSFIFHLKIRRLIGNYPTLEFATFGKNAAEEENAAEILSSFSRIAENRNMKGRVQGTTPSDCSSPSEAVREIDGPILEALIDAYFDIIHPDFPVLHESSFREGYEFWSVSNSSADPAWLCGLLCVLILARRVAPISVPAESEKKWWGYVQTLLPTIFFTSNIYAIQALMLTALHLHITNHRDACWNLTGTAVRIAFAIGLHRDDIKHSQSQSPLGRELRKQLWWTLYAFEQMQVSSYDRPSAISHTVSSVSFPNERIVGGHLPQDFMKWSQRLVVLLGSVCRALNPAGTVNTAMEDTYNRPLSPAAGILRDLHKWKETLPSHLRLEVTDSLAPSSQRQLLLLHAQYHYITVLISRSALLRRATVLSAKKEQGLPEMLISVSETCLESGRSLGRIMRKLETIDRFNALTWWDMFYTVASALVMGLDIVCRVKQNGSASSSESLRELAALAHRQRQNPRMPGTMDKWAEVVIDVNSVVNQYTSTSDAEAGNTPTQIPFPNLEPPAQVIYPTQKHESPENAYTYTTNTMSDAWNGPALLDDSQFARDANSHFWSQFSMMDESTELQDWSGMS